MEITIGKYRPDAELVEAVVRYNEIIEGHGFSAQVNVWVPNVDSLAEVRRLATEAAHNFLQRALSAHSALGHSQ